LRHEFDILEKVLSPDFSGIIVDAGGYIGSTALKLSAIYPKATIVAIEPSDENFAILKSNVENNPNILAINAALYTEGNKSVPLMDRGTGNWGFSIAVHDSANVTGDLGIVDTISLEDILLRFPDKSIGLIKLDIEGGEYSLFENPSSAMRDIPAVFVELHDRIVPGCTDVFMKFSARRWVINAGGEKLLSLKGKPEEIATSFG
jgi:FkbM family methyltransferase